MNKNTRFVFFICIAAVAGVMALQCSWIINDIRINRERFEKEANLTFEDAIKTEFKLRCDTIESAMVSFLMDTSQISITSKWDSVNLVHQYKVANKHNAHDVHSFSQKGLNLPILPGNDSVKTVVAHLYAHTYREEDLERHIIWYHTQNLGAYIANRAQAYRFDTTRLRPIYSRLLAEQNIHEPFVFYLRDADSTLNYSHFPDSLVKAHPVITKSFPTYNVESGANYVRAIFPSPGNYIIRGMLGILLASALLLAIVALAFWYLLRVIRREKKLSEIKNDFIANISHELKTPVATVSAAIDALQGFGALEDPARTARYLEISQTELQRLSDLINRILNLSLYERQNIELHMEWVDIDALIQDIHAGLSLYKEKNISFQYHNRTNLHQIHTDRTLLRNAINNLVDNAVKYSGEQVSIKINLTREEKYYILSVEDNGIGIHKNDLPFIFDKFYRVPTPRHKVKGHGLGLSYVSSIMKSLGGWCSADSRLGQGSTFKLGLKT